MRVLERTFFHLSKTIEAAEQAHQTASGTAALQRLDPRVKVVSALLITVTIVSSSSLIAVLSALLALSGLALLSNIGWRRLLAAWTSGFFFGALIAIPAIFAAGLHLASLLFFRTEVSLTCWLLVIMTTSFNRVLRALRWLRVPLVFVAILAMTFRYIFLLIEIARDMLLARRSRVVARLPRAEARRLLASTGAVLAGKSLQMSDEVYQAMISRGFRGEIHLLDEFAITSLDWLALFATATLSFLLFYLGR